MCIQATITYTINDKSQAREKFAFLRIFDEP